MKALIFKLRVTPEWIEALDRWRSNKDPRLTRSKAVRREMERVFNEQKHPDVEKRSS